MRFVAPMVAKDEHHSVLFYDDKVGDLSRPGVDYSGTEKHVCYLSGADDKSGQELHYYL